MTEAARVVTIGDNHPPEPTPAEIAAMVETNPALVLVEPDKFVMLYEHMAAEIEAERRAAHEKAAAEAETKRLADEAAARAADQKHRGEIMGAAKAAIMTIGEVDEETAKRIVIAIIRGGIPNTFISF